MFNSELAHKVLDQIALHPELHNQAVWAKKTSCGTAHCFAGWAVQIARVEPLIVDEIFFRFQNKSGNFISIGQEAERLLGITSSEADVLFAGDNYFEDLREMVEILDSGETIYHRYSNDDEDDDYDD